MAVQGSPDLVLDIAAPPPPRSRRIGVLLLIVVLGLLGVVGRYVYLFQRHLTAVAGLRGLGVVVNWGIDRGSFLQGGTTEVRFRGARDKVRDDDVRGFSAWPGSNILTSRGVRTSRGPGSSMWGG